MTSSSTTTSSRGNPNAVSSDVERGLVLSSRALQHVHRFAAAFIRPSRTRIMMNPTLYMSPPTTLTCWFCPATTPDALSWFCCSCSSPSPEAPPLPEAPTSPFPSGARPTMTRARARCSSGVGPGRRRVNRGRAPRLRVCRAPRTSPHKPSVTPRRGGHAGFAREVFQTPDARQNAVPRKECSTKRIAIISTRAFLVPGSRRRHDR